MSDQLGPVDQLRVGLFEDLEDMETLARPKAAHELDEGGGVRMRNAPIDVQTDLIHPVHKLQVQAVEERILVEFVLQGVEFESQQVLVGVAQL